MVVPQYERPDDFSGSTDRKTPFHIACTGVVAHLCGLLNASLESTFAQVSSHIFHTDVYQTNFELNILPPAESWNKNSLNLLTLPMETFLRMCMEATPFHAMAEGDEHTSAG